MYTGLKHLHTLLITLFVISVLIKAILLIANKDKFDAYRKKTKVPEMVITMLFLVTGIIMWSMKGSGLHYFFHIKMTTMIIAIPLAIVAFKKKNAALGFISASLFVVTIGLALKAADNMKEVHIDPSTIKGTEPLAYGKAMYEANCVSCHGDQGAKQLGGASDLTNIEATQAYEIANVITNGLGKMNAFKTLDSNEVKAISEYALTLKK